MESERRRAAFLVDPHRDLAQAVLGLVPAPRGGDVVYLDLPRQPPVRPEPARRRPRLGPRQGGPTR